MHPIRKFAYAMVSLMFALILAGCGGGGGASVSDRCADLASTPLPVAKAVIKAAVLNAATSSLPEHCQIDGAINERTGADGQQYAIKFRLRLPTDWNGRFYMGGGGGTNGTLVDPTSVLAMRYATIGTDSGHDNSVDNNANAGGTASFGVDPQARIDFAYNSYDQVTQIGKALTLARYQRTPEFSYFQGCSEGGREALLMSQRFPAHYDGIVSGDPVLHIPLGPMAGIHTTKTFAGLATRMGLFQANGDPALNKTFTDADLLLVREAVLAACDSLDGLADGIVDNFPACTTPLVHAKLTAVQCAGGKTASCLTADQIASLEKAFEGPKDSQGNSLYASYPWDGGIGGLSGTTYNANWRSWWLGSYNSATNNATKLNFVSAVAVIYGSPPVLPFTTADSLNFSLNYNFDTDVAKMYTASGAYTPASTSMLFTDSADYSSFRNRGGKLVIYQGVADSSVSITDTITWYDKMNAAQGGNAQSFARLFAIPGMNHCSGGPATETFDALAAVVNWVERGVAPDSILATASNPGYFGVTSRSRPLCPHPKQTRYKGTGDINDASNFVCQ